MTRFVLLTLAGGLVAGCVSREPLQASESVGTVPVTDGYTSAPWGTWTDSDTGTTEVICAYGHDVTTDAELEALSVCLEIDGDLGVGGEVTTLEPLSGLLAVRGTLSIAKSSIERLDGLENLASVSGLVVDGNAELVSIAGLNGIDSALLALRIADNPALAEISGLNGIEAVDGFLAIHDNDALTTLTGLSKLASVGDLSVVTNDALADASGLQALTTVAADANLTHLDDVNAFSGLQFIGGDLELSWDLTTDLVGFTSLHTVNGELRIDYNPFLETLDGLSSLRSVGGAVVIEQNSELLDIGGLSGLENIGGILLVSDNPRLCESQAADLGAMLDIAVIAYWNRDCL